MEDSKVNNQQVEKTVTLLRKGYSPKIVKPGKPGETQPGRMPGGPEQL